MDTGMKNRNFFKEELLSDGVFLVEASLSEMHNLWKEWGSEFYEDFEHTYPLEPVREYDIRKIPPEFRDMYNFVEKHNEKIRENRRHRVEWKEDSKGICIEIGSVDNRPVCVSFFTAKIDGKKVIFYEPVSQIVDYRMVREYLEKNFQMTHDNYTSWNHTDANNFHICVHALQKLDKEPR